MTTLLLAPLVDRAGATLTDANGQPLAADGDGFVYTMTADAGPTPMGELAEDGQGHVVLVPLGAADAAAGNPAAVDPAQKGRLLTRLGRRRAHLRGRIAHHEGRLRSLAEAGAQPGDARLARHTGRIESLKKQLAAVQAELERANAQALNGVGDVDGLGESWWVRNRKYLVGAAAGAGGALLARSAIDPDGYVGRLIRTGSFNDPASAQAEQAAAAAALAQAQGERDAARAQAAEAARTGGAADVHRGWLATGGRCRWPADAFDLADAGRRRVGRIPPAAEVVMTPHRPVRSRAVAAATAVPATGSLIVPWIGMDGEDGGSGGGGGGHGARRGRSAGAVDRSQRRDAPGMAGFGSFIKRVGNSVTRVVKAAAPIAAPIVGGVVGGPGGLMVGQAIGQAFQSPSAMPMPQEVTTLHSPRCPLHLRHRRRRCRYRPWRGHRRALSAPTAAPPASLPVPC